MAKGTKRVTIQLIELKFLKKFLTGFLVRFSVFHRN